MFFTKTLIKEKMDINYPVCPNCKTDLLAEDGIDLQATHDELIYYTQHTCPDCDTLFLLDRSGRGFYLQPLAKRTHEFDEDNVYLKIVVPKTNSCLIFTTDAVSEKNYE